jgi:hypothetical protein
MQRSKCLKKKKVGTRIERIDYLQFRANVQNVDGIFLLPDLFIENVPSQTHAQNSRCKTFDDDT